MTANEKPDETELTDSERRAIRALYPVLVAQRDAMNRAIEAMRELDALEAPTKAAQEVCKAIIAGADERRAKLAMRRNEGEANA